MHPCSLPKAVKCLCAITALLFTCLLPGGPSQAQIRKIPIIDVTDLYHPYQDPGDNFDLIAGYALPEVDLKAVVFDCTQMFRQPLATEADKGLFQDPNGPREAGFITVTQLNYIFNRNAPCGLAPFTRMKSIDDQMLETPPFQQAGIELMLKVLEESSEPVQILSFGSARPVAVAYNRNPALFKAKVGCIHLCAGSSSKKFLEWNVALDPKAMVCLLRSDLPIAIYPCATENGPFSLGEYNCYWQAPNLQFIRDLNPSLQRYLDYSFGKVARNDFLRAMDEDFPRDFNAEVYKKPHHVWETAVWGMATGRALACAKGEKFRLIPSSQATEEMQICQESLKPCLIEVDEEGLFDFKLTEEPSNFRIYHRANPEENQRAYGEALPALYGSFKP